MEIAFWNLWETAVLGQILARSLLEADLSNLEMLWAVLGCSELVLGCLEPFWAVLGWFQMF